MDAGARGRRLLQRREYKAKVSEFIPKELEDHVVYENPNTNLFPDGTQEKVKKFLDKGTEIMNKNKVLRTIGNIFKSKNPGSNYTKDGKVTAESNSAQQKAMNDAKMKKMEDDKVASKKKGMKEGTKYGMYKGSGKASGAMKDYLDKKKKEKKKVDEACWKGYEKKGMKTMFGKRYPNCVKKTKKEEVEVAEDMKGMSQKSGDKRSTESGAGMTAKGVAKYNRRTGGNLKTAVTTPPSKLKAGSKAAGRRKSFCARSKSWTGPRGKAARRRWNCSYEPELPMIPESKKKLYNTSPLSNRVSNWSKKINEGTLVRGDYGPYVSGQSNKKEKKVKIDPKKLPVAERKMTSSEKDKKEKYVKGMKKDKGGFTKRYGKDGKSVMYATATKMAMKEGSCGKGEYYCNDDQKCKPIPEGMKVGKDGMLVKEDFYKKKFDVRKGGYQKTNKMTKSNKRSGDSKAQYRQVHKDLAKEDALTDFLNNAKKVVNKINKNQQQKNDAINQVDPGSAGFKRKPINLKVEGSLHKWFKGSKSKDGKGGWVNVVTGGTCASDKPGEGTPKCVSSSKRASMSKSERLSASRRKKKADPGQQSKSGAAKPTYVATDSKKKK